MDEEEKGKEFIKLARQQLRKNQLKEAENSLKQYFGLRLKAANSLDEEAKRLLEQCLQASTLQVNPDTYARLMENWRIVIQEEPGNEEWDLAAEELYKMVVGESSIIVLLQATEKAQPIFEKIKQCFTKRKGWKGGRFLTTTMLEIIGKCLNGNGQGKELLNQADEWVTLDDLSLFLVNVAEEGIISKMALLLSELLAIESVKDKLNNEEWRNSKRQKQIMLISLLAPFVRSDRPEELRVASFQALLKIITAGDQLFALTLYNSKQGLSDLLKACNDPQSKAVQAAAQLSIVRLMDKLPQRKKDRNALKQQMWKTLEPLLESDRLQERISGFRALAIVFQADSELGSFVLNQEFFLSNLMDTVEFDPPQLQLAIIEMLSAACNEKSCRTLILGQCDSFLKLAHHSKNQEISAHAQLILTKLQQSSAVGKEAGGGDKVDEETSADLLSGFINTLRKAEIVPPSELSVAVEGVAYFSLSPEIQQQLSNDTALLKGLMSVTVTTTNASIRYGLCVIFTNMTMYPSLMTQEQRDMAKLRAMANNDSEPKDNPLAGDEKVKERGRILVKSGVIPVLCTLGNSGGANQSLRHTVISCFNNLATDAENRGALVQQGAVKCLLKLQAGSSTEKTANKEQQQEDNDLAAQTLAKIAISCNPLLAFPGQVAVELLQPLLRLCDQEQPLLRQFEALLALTNLTSMSDEMRGCMLRRDPQLSRVHYLMLSDNEQIRRAATECICNMSFDPGMVEFYATGPEVNVKILGALVGSEDDATARAAAGALAILAGSGDVRICQRIASEDAVMDTFNEIFDTTGSDIRLRIVECLRCVVALGGRGVAERVAKSMSKCLVNTLKKEEEEEEVMGLIVQVLKGIAAQGIPLPSL